LEAATIFNDAQNISLCVSQLSFFRSDAWLFKDLSFDVGPSQVVWIKGQNGRGKTSLLRILVGLAQADKGTLAWGYSESTKQDNECGAGRFVYIGHVNALKDELTASESVQFLSNLHNQLIPVKSIDIAFRKLGIERCSHQLVRNLSQGQKRRVALARLALEERPSVWILDEPFDTLDNEGIEIINNLIVEHLARKGSVIFTSHIPFARSDVLVKQVNLDEAG
jgi:heme exporter protein A